MVRLSTAVSASVLAGALLAASPALAAPDENLPEPPQDLGLRFWLLEQSQARPPIPVSQAPLHWNLGRWHEVLTLGSWPAGTLGLGGRAQRSLPGCDELANPFVCPAQNTVTLAPEWIPKSRKLAVFTGVLLHIAGTAVNAIPTFGLRW